MWNCYHRFDHCFLPAQYGSSNTNDSAISNYKNQSQILAMIASLDTVCDPNWYVDSGASSQELVHVGNGAKLDDRD